jgi:hypothetical protein
LERLRVQEKRLREEEKLIEQAERRLKADQTADGIALETVSD